MKNDKMGIGLFIFKMYLFNMRYYINKTTSRLPIMAFCTANCEFNPRNCRLLPKFSGLPDRANKVGTTTNKTFIENYVQRATAGQNLNIELNVYIHFCHSLNQFHRNSDTTGIFKILLLSIITGNLLANFDISKFD